MPSGNLSLSLHKRQENANVSMKIRRNLYEDQTLTAATYYIGTEATMVQSQLILDAPV